VPLSDRTRARLHLLLWCGVFLTVAGLLQIVQPVWFDADTSYHLAVGRLIRQHGILHGFPWTPFSVMADRYADTELLFHLTLAGLDIVVPAHAVGVAGTILGALLLLTMMLVLRAERMRLAGLWPLLALACSGAFCVRFALVRPHLLAVPLSLFIAWAAARRQFVWLLAAGLLFPWCHLGWISAVGLVALAELAHFVVSRRCEWRSLLAVVAGLAVGLLLHPNFPAIIEHAWIEIGHTLFSAAWGGSGAIPIGGEFNPFGWKSALRFVALPGALALAALLSALRSRPRDPLTITFSLVACVFLLMTLKSQRFLESLAPFAVIAAGLAFRQRPPRLIVVLLAGCLGYTVLVSQPLWARVRSRPRPFSEQAVAALNQAVPRDAQVFTCDWQLTGDMLLALPERRFMVALDPMLFYRKDRSRFELWQQLVRQGPRQPARIIRDRFGARFVLCEDNPAFFAFMRALLADPMAVLRLRAPPLTLFEIAPQKSADANQNPTERQ
jgi:hypothetical protein